MGLYLVTVKAPRNPDHDPRNKITGPCIGDATCTDQTGEHHTYLVEATDRDTAAEHGRQHYGHVTRVEDTDLVGTAARARYVWFDLEVRERQIIADLAPALAEALDGLRKLAAP